MAQAKQSFEVEEKSVEEMLVASIRFKGRYEECGKAFSKICRSYGRFVAGKPLNLYYDPEYKEEDADIESCIPIKPTDKTVEGITIRTLPAGRCISLIHQGPYDKLRCSYEKILSYIKEKGLETEIPSREIYIKGPGMIFRGNPQKYLTEIQLFIRG